MTTTRREIFMQHGWKRWPRVIAAAAILATGLGATSAGGAVAASDGHPWPSAATPAGTGVLPESDFCEKVKKIAVSDLAMFTPNRSGGADWSMFIADVQQLIASAPAEIKPDVHKLFDGLLVLDRKLSPDQADHPADAAQFGELAHHYAAYVRSHCPGIYPTS